MSPKLLETTHFENHGFWPKKRDFHGKSVIFTVFGVCAKRSTLAPIRALRIAWRHFAPGCSSATALPWLCFVLLPQKAPKAAQVRICPRILGEISPPDAAASARADPGRRILQLRMQLRQGFAEERRVGCRCTQPAAPVPQMPALFSQQH